MTRRRYQTVALVAAALMYLLNSLPAQAETENATQTRSNAVEAKQLLTQTTPSTNKKNTRQIRKKRRQQQSTFVTLSQCILDAQATEWATDHAFFDNDLANKNDRCSREAYGTLDNQPLFLKNGKANRFSGQAAPPMLRHPLLVASGDLYFLGVMVGSENNLIETSSGFNNQQRTLKSGSAKSSGSPFAYSYKADSMSLNAGISWIRDLADSNGMSKTFEDAGFERTSDKRSGLNLNLGASFRAFTLTGGYIRALDKYAPAPGFLDGSETEPSAWNGELAYTTALLNKETVLAIGYLKSSESLQLYLPEQRYITKASMNLFDSTTWSLEYYLDKDYATESGSTNEDGYGITTKIGFGF